MRQGAVVINRGQTTASGFYSAMSLKPQDRGLSPVVTVTRPWRWAVLPGGTGGGGDRPEAAGVAGHAELGLVKSMVGLLSLGMSG